MTVSASAVLASRTRSPGLAWVARHNGYLFVVPMLLYTLALTVYPIVVNLQMSLFNVDVMTFMRGGAAFVWFDNYSKLLHDPAFRKATVLSFVFTCVSILCTRSGCSGARW